MSLDAIKQISEAEKDADNERKDAYAEAKKMVLSSEAAGKEALAKALSGAEREKDKIFAEADERIKTAALEITEKTAKECGELEKAALKHMDEAVSIIVERIVSVQ
ncbi:MAG: hypothetical protein Q8878_00120 [Bacillota bacterium]|nr:hypothetical protein [Bacillota bacterium]